jgi:phosphoribosylaminoimidazole carboxylase (NCAIR synthetase)
MQANLGVRMKCLDPSPDAPASWVAKQVLGHFRDAEAIQNFASQVCVYVFARVCVCVHVCVCLCACVLVVV